MNWLEGPVPDEISKPAGQDTQQKWTKDNTVPLEKCVKESQTAGVQTEQSDFNDWIINIKS